MNVYFYNNTKRLNSTAAAPGVPSLTADCTFKNPTSLISPVITLNHSGKPTYNYFSIDNRLYWITDIVSVRANLWEISGRIDVLGTFRLHIKATNAFVLYDSTANTEQPDSRLGVNTTPAVQNNTGVMPWDFASGEGTYFVAIEGDGDLVDRGMADGATGVYITDMASIQKIGLDFDGTDVMDSFNTAMTTPFPANITLNTTWGTIDSAKDIFSAIEDSLNASDVAGVIGYGLIGWMLLPWIFWTGIIGTIKGLITGADALKHVKSAYWLPFKFTGVGVQKNKIAIGSYVDQIGTSKRISDPIKDTYAAVSIPWQYTDWRNVQNTEIQIYIPLIGVINIPASAVKGQTVITVKCSINLFSGHFSVRLECGGVDLGTYGANAMMPILIGDSNPDIPAITNTIVAGTALVAGAATGTAALTAGAAGAFVQSGLGSIQPISTTVGGIGGGCGNSLGTAIVCTTICHNTSQEPSTLLSTIGTPTNRLKQLSGSGYCQCLNAQVNCASQGVTVAKEIQNVSQAVFSDGSGKKLDKLVVDIQAIQSGSGTPSPSNPRPITGFSSTDIHVNSAITTISHDSAGTVYGGSLDVTSGVLTVTWGSVDLTTLSWTYSSTYSRFESIVVSDIKTPANNNTVINGLCSIYPLDTSNNTARAGKDNIIGCATNGKLQIRDTSLSGDISALETRLIGVTFIYELATPVTYQLTPTQINTAFGNNTIYSNTGDIIDLIYQANTGVYEPDPTQTEIEMINTALNSGVYLE